MYVLSLLQPWYFETSLHLTLTMDMLACFYLRLRYRQWITSFPGL